jgi:endonuclease/exonuclease/phosphatase (EEP) superfamily protein YafD
MVRAERLPVAVLGDLNSRPGQGAHAALVAAGLADAGASVGPTCCESRTLRNARTALDHRIDHVLLRGLTASAARRISSRTASGLWSSDHAGVVVDLAA